MLAVAATVVAAQRVSAQRGSVQRLSAQGAGPALDAGRMVREVMLEADTAGVASAEQRWRPQVRRDRALSALLDGTIARLRYQSDEAARRFAVAQADSLGRTGAYALVGLASVSGQRSQYTDAIRSYRRAAQRMNQLGDSAGQVEAMLGEAMTVLRTAGIEPAKQRFRDAALLLPDGDAWLRARHRCLLLQVLARASDVIGSGYRERGGPATGSVGGRIRRQHAARAQVGLPEAQQPARAQDGRGQRVAPGNQFVKGDGFAAADARENLRLFILSLAGNQDRDRLADRLLRRVAEQPFGALVPAGDVPGLIHRQHRFVDLVQDLGLVR